MVNKIKQLFKKNTEILALGLLVLITIISTTYYNQSKKKIYSNYKNTLHNIYFKKTINHVFNNLEPKFKKINHKIQPGETFDSILEDYFVEDKEINEIKSKLSKKVNLNRLNINQKIKFTLDQSENIVKEFTFQLSNTEKIYLVRNTKAEEFQEKTIVTKLKKSILYK